MVPSYLSGATASRSPSAQPRVRSPNPCSIESKNLKAVKSTVDWPAQCTLPLPVSLQNSERDLPLPRVQSLVSRGGNQIVPAPLPPHRGASSESYALDGLLDTSPNHLVPFCNDSTTCPPEEKEHTSRKPVSLSPRPSSKHPQDEVWTGWKTMSQDELSHESSQISSYRPPYATIVHSTEPHNITRDTRESRTDSKKANAENNKERCKKRHAHAERVRRRQHKSSLIILHESVCDLAFKKAGWDPSDKKAPTKETILTAAVINIRMLQRLDVLSRQQREGQAENSSKGSRHQKFEIGSYDTQERI